MTKRFLILLTSFTLLSSLSAQNHEQIRNEIAKCDLGGLVTLYNTNSSLTSEIEDAIDGYLDWNDYSYEQVKAAYDKCQNKDCYLKKELERVSTDKECDIYQYFSTITPEQLALYPQIFPNRKDLVDNFVNNILSNSLSEISYNDLMSLDVALDGIEIPELKKSLQVRSPEKSSLARGKIDDYIKYETSYKNKLLFVLRYRSWQYFIVRYKNVAKIYSQIGIVPADPEQMALQYSQIVQTCFTQKDFKKQLQKDIDAYNKAINNARSEFANMAGIKDYTRSNIKVPNIGSFSIKPNLSIARKIPDARNDFESSRSTAKTIAGIASFFVGTIASSIGRGLYDMNLVSELATKEMTIRKEYMRNAYNQLHKVFEGYYRTIDKEIVSQISANNLKFKNYVKSQN